MAAAQNSEVVDGVKIERAGSSVKPRQMDGSGNEVYIETDSATDAAAIIEEVANGGN